MQIKQERLEAFKELYKKQFDVELSNPEAYDKARKVLSYAKLCLKPFEKVGVREFEV